MKNKTPTYMALVIVFFKVIVGCKNKKSARRNRDLNLKIAKGKEEKNKHDRKNKVNIYFSGTLLWCWAGAQSIW